MALSNSRSIINSLSINFMLLALTACHAGKPKENNKGLKEVEKEFPIIKPTMHTDYYNLLIGDDSVEEMSTAQYWVYYIGPYQDTLTIANGINGLPPPPLIFDNKGRAIPQPTQPEHLVQFFDFENHRYSEIDTFKIDMRIDTSKSKNNFYPVLISNKTKDTIFFNNSFDLDIKMEAKDSLGHWLPIQKPYINFCGTGLPSIILPPDTYILTLAPIFKGNFKTSLRLRYGNNYSTPFIGRINYGQFKSNNYY